MPVECFGDAGEGIEPVLRAAAFLKARDHGLGCAHSLREGTLAEPRRSAEVMDQLSECEVVFDLCPVFGCRFGPLVRDVVPAGVVGQVVSLRVTASTLSNNRAGPGAFIRCCAACGMW